MPSVGYVRLEPSAINFSLVDVTHIDIGVNMVAEKIKVLNITCISVLGQTPPPVSRESHVQDQRTCHPLSSMFCEPPPDIKVSWAITLCTVPYWEPGHLSLSLKLRNEFPTMSHVFDIPH